MAADPRVIVKLVDPSAVLRKGKDQKIFIQGTETKSVVNEGWIEKCIKAGLLKVIPAVKKVEAKPQLNTDTSNTNTPEVK